MYLLLLQTDMYLLLLQKDIKFCDKCEKNNIPEITDLLQYWSILETFDGKSIKGRLIQILFPEFIQDVIPFNAIRLFGKLIINILP